MFAETEDERVAVGERLKVARPVEGAERGRRGRRGGGSVEGGKGVGVS